jgi:hypothetical protein
MPALADLLSDESRELMYEELGRLHETASLMEERGTFPVPPPPVPLHRQPQATR